MNNLYGIVKNLLLSAALPLTFAFFAIGAVVARQAPEPTQDEINHRVADIMESTLQKGVGTTPEGVRYTIMNISPTLQEFREIKKFGERAIPSLGNYLDSADYRAQNVAVKLLGSIGGKAVIKLLTHGLVKCSSMAARAIAVANLAHQNWDDVAETIKWVAVNDPAPDVRKAAADLIAKHESGAETR